MSARKPRPPAAPKQKRATTITVGSTKDGAARLSVHLDTDSYTTNDVRLFLAGINAMHATDAVLWDRDAYSELGLLYFVGWSIQDYGRKFRAEMNPLYAWRALQFLVDSSLRSTLEGNGPKLKRVQEDHAKIRRRHVDAASALRLATLPAERDRLTRRIEKLVQKSAPLVREINTRTWLGDPIPEWLSDYFQRASESLFDIPSNTGAKYPHAVAHALGLSKAGGGASAHSRLRDHERPRKQLAQRFIESVKAQGAQLSDAELARVFDVQTDTAKSWRRRKKGK